MLPNLKRRHFAGAVASFPGMRPHKDPVLVHRRLTFDDFLKNIRLQRPGKQHPLVTIHDSALIGTGKAFHGRHPLSLFCHRRSCQKAKKTAQGSRIHHSPPSSSVSSSTPTASRHVAPAGTSTRPAA